MNHLKYFYTVINATFVLPYLFTSVLVAQNNKIDEHLIAELQQQTYSEAIIIMKQQADFPLAGVYQTKNTKGQYVYQTLSHLANNDQQAIRYWLLDNKIDYEGLWIINAVYLPKITKANLLELANRQDVRRIIANPKTPLEEPIPSTMVGSRNTIEWGIQRIQADKVWEMGYKGQGVVIGGQDTGYEWDHPALKRTYRGWDGATADHNYNWHDAIHTINPLNGDSTQNAELNPCGLSIDAPCDDHSHGTHTMGIMVGEDGDNQIGVAPEARWVGVRNMERGWGSPMTYLESFQWFLAPTDLNNENPDPTKAPHVINNSWGCPEVEGCNPDNFFVLEMAVDNLKAAGVAVVVSAGNDGRNGCSTIANPATIYENSFTIGATRMNDTIATFSSRGPALFGDTILIKPNVSAPGSAIRSSIVKGQYTAFSGTSMAAPHVVGTIALMISANPDLAGQVEVIETILEQTAQPIADTNACSNNGNTQNTTYGYGIINALAAVEAAQLWTNTTVTRPEVNVKIYPNPFVNTLFVEQQNSQSSIFLLYHTNGQLVSQHSLAAEKTQLMLPNLPTGIYFYEIHNGKSPVYGKLIKN